MFEAAFLILVDVGVALVRNVSFHLGSAISSPAVTGKEIKRRSKPRLAPQQRPCFPKLLRNISPTKGSRRGLKDAGRNLSVRSLQITKRKTWIKRKASLQKLQCLAKVCLTVERMDSFARTLFSVRLRLRLRPICSTTQRETLLLHTDQIRSDRCSKSHIKKASVSVHPSVTQVCLFDWDAPGRSTHLNSSNYALSDL